MLVGREAECERMDALLAQARAGVAGVLVITGDVGIGKTELLRYAEEHAADMRVLRARGWESEAELPFAGLADLLRPVLARMSSIPPPQEAALAGALRLAAPASEDRFAGYSATLSLLAVEAELTPLLVLVDDVQWLDAATLEALAFVCRRLSAEPVVVLLSSRETEGSLPQGLMDLPVMLLDGLDANAAEVLLGNSHGDALSSGVRRQLATATQGNPLALLEIPNALSAEQRSGTDPLPDPLPVGPIVRRAFGRRLEPMPLNTKTALLVAAVSDSSDLAEIERALLPLSIGLRDLGDAEAAGLIMIAGDRVEFVHPLMRSTVFANGDRQQRRAAHQLLADALVGDEGADRRAWHQAAASVGPDESVAQSLEGAAEMARRRGGPVGAASAFERSARLSPEPSARVRRFREAAADWILAGEPARAEALLDEAVGLDPDAAERALIVQLQANLASYTGRTERAYALLTDEAARAESGDPGRAALLLAKAVLPLLADGDVKLAAATAARAQSMAKGAGGLVSAQVNAIVVHVSVLAGQGRDMAPRLDTYEALLPKAHGLLRVRLAACSLAAAFIWTEQFDRARRGLARVVRSAREAGAPAMLPYPLVLTCEVYRRTGEWAAASAAGHEAVTLARQLRQPGDLLPSLVCLAELEAGQGRESECRDHAREALEIAGERGFRAMVTVARHALGLLALGLGRPAEAIPELEKAQELARAGGLEEPAVVEWAPDLVEAYVRCGQVDDAQRVMDVFTQQVDLSGQNAGMAAVARCRGLLDVDGDYERWFTEAAELHKRAGMPFELARSQLCFGERLRRDRRRVDARVPIRGALEAFEQLGAMSWAERAAVELRATGENVPVRADTAEQTLTPQEMQVSLAVSAGATSREAAAALFLSPRTVEHHLGNVYQKLGVRSRSQLVRLVVSGLGPFASVQSDTLG